ncbi:Vacuolar protein sorting-associated protein 35 [Borealophlyctis nickersoniae]|nr:Vacuolar protein sorting-associated protein 35 [Borealophlyctis nickersoniae]
MDDQGKILEEALSVVKVQAFHMKRCLDNNKLMDALKHCSTMLAELRTSSLTPKNYYELYMSIFDELRHLTTYLYDAHMNHRHHLSDLYELVQYAGNIVPRLYLMITVGSVYMRVSKEILPTEHRAKRAGSMDSAAASKALNGDAEPDSTPEAVAADGGAKASATPDDDATAGADVPPIKELMKDMLEMSRGVQHPTRGLFLRYYLSAMTRDYLPDGLVDGPHGSIHDSMQFILQNFIEMNKLWVRLQHQGHSREREKREQERKELRLLVGSNLVRLSQLEGLDLDMYKSMVLPSILEEIVSCRDVIAQEYLMEVIIQVFHDDFHLRSLDAFLSATAQLQRNVNVKQIVISLIDRFASYAARARDEAEAAAKESEAKDEESKQISGIPDDVQLFDVFWGQITELVKARPEFTVQDVVALLVSLENLSLNCYPEHLDYVDKVLGFAKDRVLEAQAAKAPELRNSQTISSVLQLLLAPVHAYNANILTVLQFPSSVIQTKGSGSSLSLAGNYADLLFLQPYATRRQVAHTIASAALRAFTSSGFIVDSADGVNALLGELCSVMIRDQKDGGLFGPKPVVQPEQEGLPKYAPRTRVEELPLDWEDVVEEQNLVAKLVHLFRTSDGDADSEFMLLSTARKHFGEGGEIRIRFTLPPLVIASIKLARKFRGRVDEDDSADGKLQTLFKFLHQTVSSLARAREHFADDEESGPIFRDENPLPTNTSKIGHGLLAPPDMALRLFLMAAQAADESGFEELAYEFFVQAFTIYEDSISESKAQLAAITLIIGTLHTTTVFGYENYETLVTKCAVHCSRLLKRVDQCRGITLVSHLFWGDEGRLRGEGKPAYRDGRRVLECLQKALKVADSVMDKSVNVELFVEILERYIWYFEKRNDAITVKYLNSLVDLIQTNLTAVDSSAAKDKGAGSGGLAIPHAFKAAGPLSPTVSTSSLFDDDALQTGGATANRGKKASEAVLKHFRNVMAYIASKQEEERAESALWRGSKSVEKVGKQEKRLRVSAATFLGPERESSIGPTIPLPSDDRQDPIVSALPTLGTDPPPKPPNPAAAPLKAPPPTELLASLAQGVEVDTDGDGRGMDANERAQETRGTDEASRLDARAAENCICSAGREVVKKMEIWKSASKVTQAYSKHMGGYTRARRPRS